jgi:glycosyltransferase involved in cell wall biosynthesis
MKVALLHTRLSGYLAACLRELKCNCNAELLIYCWPQQQDAPFDARQFADLGMIYNRQQQTDPEILESVRAFHPNAILTSGWIDKGYVRICRQLRNDGIPVIAGCDTQWTGSVRQQIAGLTAKWHIRRSIDVLWVTGERQAVLARALGYHGDRLWDGYYACDWEAFAKASTRETGHEDRKSSSADLPYFLFVGRYVEEKAIDVLADAYLEYQRRVAHPWRLVCAGTGPLRDRLLRAGAEDRGFVQPSDLPALMHSASAFILPSRFEPWGVVVQEAAASRLPLILSDACGAGVHLLREHLNGYSFPLGDKRSLADRMIAMTEIDPHTRLSFSNLSFQLSQQYTPNLWALTLVHGLKLLNP